jgi:hypothetical protein
VPDFRAFFADRRKVFLTAGAVGGGLGLIALARSGSKNDEPAAEGTLSAPLPIDASAINGTYPFGGVDNSLIDSTSAETILGAVGDLGSTIGATSGTVENTITNLADVVADLANEQRAFVAQQPAVVVAPVLPAPAAPRPNPGTTPPAASTTLPRWTPHPNVRIGGKTDMAGVSFAGRTKLTNGEYAPIVKYQNGNTQIHPTWQAWMEKNRVRKAD